MADLGEMLRETREKKRLTIAEVAIETRMRGKIILALEAGDYQQLPPEPFIRGLLKNYARFLGLEPDLVLDAYAIETGIKPAPVSPPEPPVPESQERSPAQTDLPAASKPPPIFVLPPDTTKTEESNRSKTHGRLRDVPPFLSSPAAFQSKAEGSVSVSTRLEVPPAPPPYNPAVSTREPSPLFAQGPQPVFQVAPEVEPQPATAPDQVLWIHRISATKLPEAVAAVAVAVAIFALAALGYTRFFASSSSVSQIASRVTTATATATSQQATPTLPTPVPTFEATAVGGVESSPTATKGATASPAAPLAIIPVDVQMEIQISAADPPVWAWVVVDNVEAFKGDIQNDTKTWTAHERLYIQVKDLPNGTVTFNGKPILPRVFAERKILERAWEMNVTGTAVPIEPLPFLPTSTRTATETPTPAPTNTPTLIPTSSPSPTPTESPSPTATISPTESSTPTASISPTATTTEPAGAALDLCPAEPGSQC